MINFAMKNKTLSYRNNKITYMKPIQSLRTFILTMCILLLNAPTLSAQDYKYKWSADRGDGTFVNPICNGDFPDCDVIRVDDTYYFVSTTMYHFPGATIMKSYDLVNWEYCANPLLQIDDTDAYNLLNGGTHYAQGMWASSLNYHDGKFYLYFIAYGRSGYDNGRNILLTATDPEGEWKMEYWPEHYYDSGWLFDDGENGDGYVYVACGIGDIWVNKLNAKTLAKISSTKVYSKDANEGSHMYHIGDYYYIYITTGGYWRGQTILRSKKPMGPYEEFTDKLGFNLFQGDGIHQGALVETQTGEWWTVLFKDAGAIGRVPYLEPVTWEDGWPRVGVYSTTDKRWTDVSRKGAKYKKPNVGKEYPKTYLPTNDAFASYELGKQWAWNHNPQPFAWSLSERPGWMRLYSCTVTDDLMAARGSLTQRILGYSAEGTASSSWKTSYGTIKLDLSAMQDGDVAGLAVVQNPYSYIAVEMRDGKKYFVSRRYSFDSQKSTKQEEKTGKELTSDIVYLRATSNFGTKANNFYYSYDASSFTKFGVSMTMAYTLDHFVGQRYYIFNYSTKAIGGHIDIDWFTTEQKIIPEDFDQLDADQEPKDEESADAWKGLLLDKEHFNPSIIGTGTFNATTKALKTSAKGLAGWKYSEPWDISQFKYLVVNLARKPSIASEVRIYDKNAIWFSKPYVVSLKSQKSVQIELDNMITSDGTKIDPSNVVMIAFSTDGSTYIYPQEVFLSDDGKNPTGINSLNALKSQGKYYDLNGRATNNPGKGIYIRDNKKVIRK